MKNLTYAQIGADAGCLPNWTITNKTRKLSYRKDDRAMRPIYGCPEKFLEPLSTRTPTATFPEILMGFCFDRYCVCAYKIILKFVHYPFLR